jgi:peptidoglycan/LPS O-acetylase OafA/YrhL
MDYRKEIDGLRAIAVLPVILFHAGFEAFGGGFVGVDVFFVISGYLITSIILLELEQGRFSIADFYERRARRILPALFVVMFVCLPFAWLWLLPGDMKDFSQSLIAVSVFGSNILFWRESGYFDTTAEIKPLLHTWSLAVEEQYYVLLPLFLMFFWRLGKFWILMLLGIVFFSSLVLAQWASVAYPIPAFFLLPTRGWELLIGAFSAFYLSKSNGIQPNKMLGEIGGWLGVGLILFAVITFSKATPFPGFYALVPTVGAVLIILFATKETSVGQFVGNKVFVGLGLISYSAYLWHQPLFAFARHKSVTEPSELVYVILSIATIVVAFLSWHFVEAPFRVKNNFSRKRIFILSLSGSLFFIFIGIQGHINEGFEQRFEKVLNGDIGQDGFFQYMDKKYIDCESKTVASQAPRWDGYLRCKQSKQGTPEVVLLGDSHAEHFFLGLAENLPSKNVAYYIFGGRPYLDNPEFKSIFEAILSDSNPQHIILTMHFFGRVDSSGAGLHEGFSPTIKTLLRAGKKVTLVGDIPHFKQDSAYCVYSRESKHYSSCSLTMEEVSLQKNYYEEILKKLSDENNLIYVPADVPLCGNNECAMSLGKNILYRDSNHLNIIGSKLVGKYLSEAIPF